MCLLVTTNVGAQDEDVPVTFLVYMDADDGGEYEEVEEEIWRPVHAQRVRDGKIIGWYLYQVVNAMDGHSDFNYMIVEVYPNWKATEAPYANVGKLFEEVHGNASIDDFMERTENSRDLVRQDRWLWQMGTNNPEFTMSDVKYVVVDWMDIHPGQWSDYLDMEREYYMPVHQKRVDAGNILGWGLWTKMGYSELPGSIDAATSANYSSYEALWNSYPEDAWESVHSDLRESQIYKRMRETRMMTGSSILRLVDYVDATNASQD